VQTEPKVNILMIDDTPNNLFVLEATLEDLGQNLVRAGSGFEALRKLLDDDFALILVDVQMPGMDGFEVADLIRQRDRSRHTPIIFLTAYERTDAQMFRGYAVGAVDFLFKPIVPEVLRSKVRVFVDLHLATDQVRRQAEQLRESERREMELRLAEERRRAVEERVKLTLQIARDIQQKLFPAEPPSCPEFEIGGMSHPAESTGGDYFDYIPLADDGVGVAIGDVCGHGVGPALLMAATRAYLRALALSNPRVGDILNLANRALAADVDEGRFVTLFLCRLDPVARTLVYVSAGHPPGYVVGHDGTVRVVLDSTGLPLGLIEEADFPEAEAVALEPGDHVLLLTDGIIEATGPDQTVFGTERAIDVVRAHRGESASQIVEALHKAVRDFAGRDDLIDDVTSVVIKVTPGAGESFPASVSLA
jgi:serine phosphatase RsbU (regulator of sigma subunit)